MRSTTSPLALRAIVAAVSLLPLLAAAQNLVPNPNFDTSLDNWTPVFGSFDSMYSLTLDAAEGSPSPPSMLFTQLQPSTTPEFRYIGSACFAVTPGQLYDLSYDTRRRPGPVASGVSLRAFSDAACTNSAGSIPTTADNRCNALSGGWLRCYHQGALAPVGAASARVHITAPLMFANDLPLNQFRIDNVRFGPTGTVPVELQSFEIR